jgi:purine-nucleoside phosphorylase
MTDSLVNHEYMSAEDRQSSLKEMVTLALDVAVG